MTDDKLATIEREFEGVPELGALQDFSRYRQKPAVFDEDIAVAKAILKIDFDGWGGATRPLHMQHTGIPSPITDPSIRHASTYIETNKAFKGVFSSELIDGKLMIPLQYKDLLANGAIITPGLGKYLMLFGSMHWERMKRIMGEQVGLNIDKNSLVKHIYGRHQKVELLFEKNDPNKLPFIYLNKELIKYARLEKDVVTVGMLYHAEIYGSEAYANSLLEPEDAAKLTKALSEA